MAHFIKIANIADLAPGEGRCVETAGKKIALFKRDLARVWSVQTTV